MDLAESQMMEHDAGGGGDVERIHAARHGDAHRRGAVDHRLRQARVYLGNPLSP